MADLSDYEPLRPRLGGRGPMILGIAGFAGALLIFALVLMLLGALPNPVGGKSTGLPAPTGSPGPSQLPKSARFAQQGDCVLNIGTQAKPEMIMVLCASEALEVIERLEGTIKVEDCRQFSEYRFHYYYDSELGDSFDFVLCMRKRP